MNKLFVLVFSLISLFLFFGCTSSSVCGDGICSLEETNICTADCGIDSNQSTNINSEITSEANSIENETQTTIPKTKETTDSREVTSAPSTKPITSSWGTDVDNNKPAYDGLCNLNYKYSCLTGNPANISDTDLNYVWDCSGINGGLTAHCSILKLQNGVCGTTMRTCTAGQYIDQNDTNTAIKWNCLGVDGGITAECSLSQQANGSCGNFNSPIPCNFGVFIDTPDTNGYYNWTCGGINEGASINCSQKIVIRGVCGTDVNSCLSGTFIDEPDSALSDGTIFRYSWQCLGEANRAYCKLNAPRNGICGGANYCLLGTLIDLEDTNTEYLWDCNGVDGGKLTHCSAYKKINGDCGNDINSCLRGDFNDSIDSYDYYNWTCKGKYGGGNDLCSLHKPVDGLCRGSRYDSDCGSNTIFIDTPDNDLNYNWDCNGLYGGKLVHCSEPKPINGVCGTTKNSCVKGTLQYPREYTYNYEWSCYGLYSGTNASCEVSKLVDGTCGTNKTTFKASVYRWPSTASTAFCKVGTPSPTIPSFPAKGKITRWTCLGVYNGVSTGKSTTCYASRLSR